MNALNSKIRFTYDDYKSLPESMDRRYELMDGELVMAPVPSTVHQRISRNLEYILIRHVKENDLGEILYAPVDVVLGHGDEREVVQPDLVFISKSRSSIVTVQEIQGAPDLVVEILSPATEARDRYYKKSLYARYGVHEYWLVSPETCSIEMYQLGAAGFEHSGAFADDMPVSSRLLPIPRGRWVHLRAMG